MRALTRWGPLASGLLLLASPSAAEFQWRAAENPAKLGWSVEKLDAAQAYARTLGTESVMIVDGGGTIVRQWGPVGRAFDVFSIRKSLLSLLFGIHADAGRIKLDATLKQLGIDDKQGLTEAERRASVTDLLMARSGVYHPAAWETPGMVANRPARGSHAPGEHWYYNNWDFNALNTIFARATGSSVTEALLESLAHPLGLEDFSARHSFALYEELSEHPSALLWMSARDLARIGLMLLNDGRWEGRQVVPERWIRESTAVGSELGLLGGYGHSWWVASGGEHFPFVKLPDLSFSARGTGEQVLLVIPELKTVIVHRAPVCGPGSELMHVTDFGHLLARILDARGWREVMILP